MTKPMQEPTFLILTALMPEPLHGYALLGPRSRASPTAAFGYGWHAVRRVGPSRRGGTRGGESEEVVNGRLRRTYRVTGAGAETLAAEVDRMTDLAKKARARLRGRTTAAVQSTWPREARDEPRTSLSPAPTLLPALIPGRAGGGDAGRAARGRGPSPGACPACRGGVTRQARAGPPPRPGRRSGRVSRHWPWPGQPGLPAGGPGAQQLLAAGLRGLGLDGYPDAWGVHTVWVDPRWPVQALWVATGLALLLGRARLRRGIGVGRGRPAHLAPARHLRHLRGPAVAR